MIRHGVSHLQCTPSLARILMMDPQARSALRPLRQLLLGGEALPVALAAQLREVTPAGIHNMYGPTETTIWSATHSVGQVGSTVPIGRPIANTTLYILDQHLQPVPIGVSGELFIGGAGVVRGYWNRPELTNEKFIQDPFSDEPGARLYRTGDRARYQADGNIEFLGRLDHQVKIRGYRIELEEIEAVLEQHPAVREAIALVHEDMPDDKRLVAYLTTSQQTAPAFSELRNFLKEKLPEYMLPAAFVMLDTLPLTPNGKVNRKGLPAPDQARPELKDIFVAPRTPLEEVLTGIWTKLLGVERVGIHDNFFELGGHSLSAVSLISQLRDSFRLELPLRSLFENPTVADLLGAMIARETKPGQTDKIAQVIRRVESMSEEEVKKSLQEKGGVSHAPRDQSQD
jgi:acyl carrier protein